jgi:hypothetical protein
VQELKLIVRLSFRYRQDILMEFRQVPLSRLTSQAERGSFLVVR